MKCTCNLLTGLMALFRVVLGADIVTAEEANLRDRLEKRVYRDAGEANPCFLVAPQCPVGSKWVEVPWDFQGPHQTPEEPSPAMRLTMELLDALEDEFSIDPDRRYVTGLSMGGFGTFDLLVRRGQYFAAGIPICGGLDESRAKEIAHVPFWVFHGSNDPAVPVVRSRSAVEALKAAGGDPKYTEYEGMGHNVWSRAYHEPELRDWLFRQHRRAE